jgi:hypothetical protein
LSSLPAPHPHRNRYLFAAAIGLGAFLLFQVQFIMGKEILPWFGGAPAVWTTCMLFFQVGLLLGYLYAHVLSEKLPPRGQRMVHLLVLGLTLGLLLWRALAWPSPLTPGDAWKPRPSEPPVAKILTLLSFSVGLPYLVLSATGPLLQSWFSRAWPAASPYRLYALSNLGSLLGLLSYPFLLEPIFPLGVQGWLWGVGFAVFAAGCAATAVFVGRLPPASRPLDTSPAPGDEAPPAVSRRILWFFLAAVASIMLLAVTNQICQEVAVIPFLWVLPLILYLLSFILCFEYEGFYRRWFWVMLLALAAGAAVAALTRGTSLKVPQQIGIYSFVLWAYCMACHGELVSLKPAARRLTSFYLTVAAGGAAGGILTGLVAPRIFPAFWELHCALFAGPALVVVVLLLDRSSWLHLGARWRVWTLRLVLTTALAALGVSLERLAADSVRDSEVVTRNFFGVLRVIREDEGTEDESLRLRHGRITHGMQLTAPARRREPTTYYGPTSGVGLMLEHHSRREAGQPLRVGVVGLGTGTLAAYARPGDTFRIYEINPEVVRLSSGPHPVFTFLHDAPGQVTTVLGDARLSLEREPPQNFDVLALDAFSSDSIPVHLITREAFALYLSHLRPGGGVLAVHVSNKYLDLKPVVRGLAGALGLRAALVDSDESGSSVWSSDWILLAHAEADLGPPEVREAEEDLDVTDRRLPLWTDTYSNLLRVVKFR